MCIKGHLSCSMNSYQLIYLSLYYQRSISSKTMAYQSFTNVHISDKQFAALGLPPKAPTSNKHKPNDNEVREILFQAENVLKAHENPSLLFPDEQVHGPPNSPNVNINALAHAKNSLIEAKIKRVQANKAYSARYRNKKITMLHRLESQAKSLEEHVEMIQSQMFYLESTRDKLVEENITMKVQCNMVNMLIAEKEAENRALMLEVQRLRNSYY